MNEDRNVNFKYEIGQRIITYKEDGSIKKDITITDRKYEIKKKTAKRSPKGYEFCGYKYYKYKCNICGFDSGEYYRTGEYKPELWTEEYHIEGKGERGCACCSGGKIVVIGINDIKTKHPELSSLINDDINKLARTSHKYVDIICPNCKNKRKIMLSSLTSLGFTCNICGDGISFPNKVMFNVLKQIETTFEYEYSPEWIGQKRYDFYIPNKNLIIEMDGGFHFTDVPTYNQTVEEVKEKDDYKDKIAKEHGINVVRINCYYKNKNRLEYIKENLIKELSSFYNFDKVDWNTVYKNSCESLVYKVAELKNRNPNLRREEIGLLIGGYSVGTVKNLLSQCRELKLIK